MSDGVSGAVDSLPIIAQGPRRDRTGEIDYSSDFLRQAAFQDGLPDGPIRYVVFIPASQCVVDRGFKCLKCLHRFRIEER
jgi:hypothetical protein